VQIRNNIHVKDIRPGEVELANGEVIRAGNVIWAAGVAATPLTRKLGVECDRGGRLKVDPDLSLPGHPEIYCDR
jgi:NADH dehydrogenase